MLIQIIVIKVVIGCEGHNGCRTRLELTGTLTVRDAATQRQTNATNTKEWSTLAVEPLRTRDNKEIYPVDVGDAH